jgi:hypothetical protein
MFFGVVISIVGGRGEFIFSCCHNYNKGRFGFVFFCSINTIGGGIYLRFLSWCNDEEEQHFFGKGCDFNVLELASLLYK